MQNELTREQLRTVADYLYDGEPLVAFYMSKVREFKRGDEVLLWFCRNQLRGKRLVEYFKNHDDGMGVLLAVQKALDYIDGRKYYTEKLTLGNLK